MDVTAKVIDSGPLPAADGAGEWDTVGPGTGFPRLAQALLHLAPGERLARAIDRGHEEVLFVLAGAGTLHLGGEEHPLEAESGVHIAPGEQYELENNGRDILRMVSVRIPDPDPPPPAQARTIVRRLEDQESEAATTDREFRIIADPDSGLSSATHFVGYIPTARAPEHFHTYDEVIYVLDGEGVFHAHDEHEPLRPGSCIQLPARTIHCLENTGESVMRVLAVFRPAGSPAAAYYPDGTPAYPGMPSIPTP